MDMFTFSKIIATVQSQAEYLAAIPWNAIFFRTSLFPWAEHVARMGEERGVYRVLVGKPEGRRPRRRWVENIKMDLQGVGCGYMDWIGLA